MTVEQLIELRTMLGGAADTPEALAEVMQFFLDHSEDPPDVLKFAVSSTNPFLEDVLKQFADEVFGKEVDPDLVVGHLSDVHFYYGSFQVEGLFGTLIYFSEGLLTGLISMPPPQSPQNTELYKRFTTTQLPGE